MPQLLSTITDPLCWLKNSQYFQDNHLYGEQNNRNRNKTWYEYIGPLQVDNFPCWSGLFQDPACCTRQILSLFTLMELTIQMQMYVEEGNVQRTIQISCLLLCKIQVYPLLLQLTGQVNSILLLSCIFLWKPVNDSIGTKKQLRKNTGAYDMFDSFPSISAL